MQVERRQRIRRAEQQFPTGGGLRRWQSGSIAPITIWFAPYEEGRWGWFAWCSTTSERVGQDYCGCWDDVARSAGAGIRSPDSWLDGGRRVLDRRLPNLPTRVADDVGFIDPAAAGRLMLEVGWIWLLVAYHRGDHIHAVAADPVTYLPFCCASGTTFAGALTAVLGGMAPPQPDS